MALNFIKEAITLGADKITDKTFTFFKQGFRLNGAIGEPEYRDVTVSGVDVLNLPNAKANGLNYCKLYGKCEQKNLPEEYTQVEYLETTGTQYINTGIVIRTSPFEIFVDFQPTTLSDFNSAYGARRDNMNSRLDNWFGANGTGGYGTNGTSISALNNFSNVRYKIVNTRTSITKNGVSDVYSYNNSANIVYSMYIGATNNSNSAVNKLIGKIYQAYIKKDDVLVFNGIPARRNSDSVLGMYDTVTGNFLTNAGTGTFIAGNDVVPTPTPAQPLNIICNNGVLKVSPNLFNKNGQYIEGFVNADTGVLSPSAEPSNHRSFIVPCLPNTTYILQGMTASSTWGSFTSSAIGTQATSYVRANTTLTTGSNDKYLIGLVYTTSGIDYRNTLQIEAGTTATDYMPYKQVYTDGTVETVKDSLNNTATAEYLLAVENYKDEQEVLTGNVTRNFAIKVLDGTEAWTYQDVYSRFNTEIENLKPEVRNTPIACTHYQAITDGREIDDVPNNSIYSITIPSRISIKTNQYTSVDTFTSFLKQQYANGTPVIIVYQLSTPTTSTVTAQTLTTKKGANTIEITQASLNELQIEVNYKAGVSVTVTQIENANLDNQVTVTIGG